MTNEALIRELVADAHPVRRLAPPGLRCAGWLALTLVLLVASTLMLGARGDLGQRSQELSFLLDGMCLLLLGTLSARSAFQLSVPARRSAVTLGLPLAGAVLWLVLLASRCLGAAALGAGPGLPCVLRITGLGMLSLLVGWRMQRRASLLEAGWTGLFLALAAFSFAALASRVLCARDGVAHLLFWHCLPVFVLTAVAAVARRGRGYAAL